MLIRTKTLDNELHSILDRYFSEGNAYLFDIETTGLSRRQSHLYLIGLICKQEDAWIMTQWLLDRPTEEPQLLEVFSAFLREHIAVNSSADPSHPPVLIHFNGDQFDIPYMRFKYEFFKMEDPFAGMESLDIYRKVRPLQKALGLTSLRQKDLETFLAVDRDDEMSGGELIGVYQEYLRSGSEGLLHFLFLHNHDDCEGMIRILPILSVTGLLDSAFSVFDYSFADSTTADHPCAVFRILPQTKLPVFLPPEGITAFCCKEDAADPCSCFAVRLQQCEDHLVLTVPLECGMRKHFFSDYKNYYYLPREDQALHKDVAIYVDPEFRVKAKAATCYQKKEGYFLPQPVSRFAPVFYRDYKSGPALFEADGCLPEDPELLHLYVYDLLRLLLTGKTN